MAVQINVAANQAALTASIQAGVQAYNQRFAQNNPINLSINQRAFSQPLGRMTGDVKDFEAALAASNARVIAFGASTAVLGGVIRSFKELANVTIDVEKNLADINRVFGLTTSQLQKFSTDLFSVGKQTASSFDDASKAALEFSRQGLKAEEVLIRTKDALTLARVAGISTANSVDALTSTINGFAATGVTTTQILNKLVAVEQDFAVGAGDLAEALSRTGQAAQEAGVSLDQLNALVTAAQQSTARGGAVIGNALKTIFTRLQRTETLDQLEAFNIAVRDVQGNTLPAVTVLQNFAGAYKNLGDAQRAQLSEQVAGVYQVNILKAIVGDLNKSQGVYAGALQRGASATNEAEVATAKLNQTLDALLKQTATSTQQLANNIGKVTFEPLARYGTEQLKSLVESMNEILEGEGVGSTFANGLLKGIRNVIAGPGAIAAFFTLFKLIQNSFTYLAQALPQIAGITTETQNRKNIEQSILQIMQQQGPVSQALAGAMGNQAAQAQLLLQLARQQTAEYQIQSTLAKQLATQLAGQGVRVKGSGGLQVTRAGGYIPNATRMAEAVGAQAGGYAPGKVVKSPVGGVMNTAEDVKYVPGFAQPFINPPAESKAGRAHRQNSISRTGVDPYMNSGFIPNFALTTLGTVKERKYASKTKQNSLVTSKTNTGPKYDDLFAADIVKKQFDLPYGFLKNMARTMVSEIYNDENQLKPFIDQYENKVDPSSLTRTETALKNIKNTSGFTYALNQVQGLLGEAEAYDELKQDGYTSTKGNKFFDLSTKDGKFAEVRARKKVSINDVFQKAISQYLTTTDKSYRNTNNDFIDVGSYDVISPSGSSFFSNGFIPNFAIPVDSARIPWFKKYASSYKNTASDKDIFRQIDFPTYGKGLDHTYAKIGNPDMVSFLYEDFVRSAMNIALGSKQVIRSKEAGFKNTPTNAISNRDPIDLAKKLSGGKFRMLEVKQSKDNQKQTISQISDAKLRGLFEENPELAKNVELMSIIFNDPKYVDPTGKSPDGVLNPFEQSIAPIVKNSYANVDSTMRGKLGLLTDGLMRRYQSKKNSFSKGFIPNFASMMSSSIKGKGNISAIKTGKNDYEIEGVEVGKKFRGQGLGSQLYGNIAQKIGSGSTIKSVLLPQEQALADYASGKSIPAKAIFPQLSWAKMAKSSKLLINGKEIAMSDFESGIAAHKYNAAKLDMALIELVNSHASGFIPNFAYQQAVMSLEEGMSGEKAIFDTKPFPHIRNKSQPTFSSAIADHGGLGNALSDSMRGQKSAGLMSKGYVPNFAAPQNNKGFDVVRFSSLISKSVDDFGKKLSFKIGTVKENILLGLSLMNRSFDPQKIERTAESTAKKIVSSMSKVGNQFTQTISSSGIDAISNIRNKFTSQNSSKSTGDKSSQRPTAAQMAASFANLPTKNSELKASAANTVDSSRNPKFSRFSRGLSRAGTAISIAGPTIAGFAEQSIFGDKKRSEMSSNERMAQSFSSTGLSAVTTGVGIGAQAAGLPGALIGGTIGGLIALKSALDSASLSVEELKERQEEQKNKIIENISSAERYLVIQEEISKSTSPKDIKKNIISLRAELSSIKDADFANKIKLAGTDINSLSAVVQEYSLKQKEATSVLNDAILVQKKYSFETLKSAGLLKIKEEGGTGASAQAKKFLSGSVNSIAQFLGIGGTKETELAKLDFSDKKTRETVYKENPGLFKSLSKIDPNTLVDIGNVFAGEVNSTMGFGGFGTGELTDLLKKGGLKDKELEETVAVLKEAGNSSNLLGNTLADAFSVVVAGFTKFTKGLKTEESVMSKAAEAVANLNQKLKDFVNDLDYSFKDLSRQDEFEKNLRAVRRPNTMMIDESLYGKRSSLQTQYDFDIQDAESEKRTKELGISKTLLTTNIQDYYNLSDAQKTAYLALSKSFDLSKPEENLKKTENFVKDQFGTLDMQKATDKQKDYLQKISNIRKDIALTEKESADDLAIAAEKFKEALMAMELSRDFVFQFKAGFRDLATEGEMLIGAIGRQLPKMFADGLVDGIKAAIRESDNLGQALTGIASKFLDEISTMMMRSGIYQIMGSFAPSLAQGFGSAGAIPIPSQKGGIIRAQSGMYISGTGTGDKYPAMLENGEYVLNRRAVMAMGGPAALDTLNFSAAPRFASGGAFSKEFNDISSMENNMTQMGLENDPYYNELTDAAKQKAAEDRAKKLADKQQKAAMIGSLVAAAATIAVGAGISNIAQNAQATKAQTLSGKLTSSAELTKAESMSIKPLMDKGLLSSTGQYTGGTPNTGFKSIFSGPLQSGQLPFYQRGSMNPFAPKKAGKQTGGLIGSRLSDTIPGYMEGGLYDSPMVKRYGTGMQNGGSPISSTGNSNSTVNNNTNANNSFNFNTSIQRDGSLKMGSNTTSYEQQDVELSKNLNNKIYAAVGEVIRKEKQFGGSLAGARNS